MNKLLIIILIIRCFLFFIWKLLEISNKLEITSINRRKRNYSSEIDFDLFQIDRERKESYGNIFHFSLPFFESKLSCKLWRDNSSNDLLSAGNCKHFNSSSILYCYAGGINDLIMDYNDTKIHKLEVVVFCEWPSILFNPSIDLNSIPQITTLIIEYGLLQEITEFPVMHYLEFIKISWTNLTIIRPKTFKYLNNLHTLDLKWNRLFQLDPLVLPKGFQSLYLSDNPWNCTRNLKWLAQPERNSIVSDRTKLICTDRKYRARHLLTVMNYKLSLKSACQQDAILRNCSCSMHHIIPKVHLPLYTVNCSHMNLTDLPAFLPANTTSFFANDNMIKDVLPLRNNDHYRHVVDIHLDNNLVENIDVLEGGYWLEHFRLLSLKGNRLRKLPVYALDNALEDNPNASLLLLSMNPWYCSCKFAMKFRELLMKYKAIMKDAWNITCTYRTDNVWKTSIVMTITRNDVCQPNDQYEIYYLDLLNGILAVLIILILSKLAYDYYHYKYYGQVPWIVMKIP